MALLSFIEKNRRFWRGVPSWAKVGLLAIGCVSGCGLIAVHGLNDMCGSGGSYVVDSPKKTFRAVLYEYDCGATTDFGTRVAVVPGGKTFDARSVRDDAVVFIGDSDHQQVPTDQIGLLPVELKWSDENHLVVTVPARARVFRKKDRVGSVQVLFGTDAVSGVRQAPSVSNCPHG